MALETERTKNAQLAARIKSMEHAAYKSSTPSNPSVPNDIEESAVKTELKQLKDKIALLTRRVEEERSQKMMLKTELRQTQTALQLELGEFQPIRNVLESKGTWRGRAQQIANLKVGRNSDAKVVMYFQYLILKYMANRQSLKK